MFRASKIHNYFLEGESKGDTLYNLTDTVFAMDGEERIMILCEFENGNKISARGFYDNGNMYRETGFNGMKRHGFDIRWYKNGERKSIMYFENGQITIPALFWYQDGSLYRFKDFNKRITKTWFRSGKLETESFPDSLNLEGLDYNEYYENGQLRKNVHYNIGRGEYVEYYQNGTIARSGYIYNLDISRIGQ